MTNDHGFDELRAAAREYGLSDLARHLDDPRVADVFALRRARHTWLTVMAVLAFLLPALWVGATAITGVRVGTQAPTKGYAGPVQVYAPGSGGGAQTLGVGGVATAECGAANVTCLSADSTSTLGITTSNHIWDCQGHTVRKIDIAASGVTVQNCFVRGATNAGIYTIGSNNKIQNNDVAQVSNGGTGDINAITFFGNGTQLLFNRLDNVVAGDAGDSHTDCMQTWATPSKGASSGVTIKGNYCSGPGASDAARIHQCIMAEGPASQDGGGGASGTSQTWTVEGNYCRAYGGSQSEKYDDIHNVTIKRNTYAGSTSKIVAIGTLSTGINFITSGADANIITGSYGATVGG